MKQNHDAIAGGMLDFISGGHCDARSCAWAKDADGNKILDSEGKCCTCDVGDQLFGGKSGNSRSGKLNCMLLGRNQASAHCMRLDALWYNVYEIGAPRVISEVDIIVMRHTRNWTQGTGVCSSAAASKDAISREHLRIGSQNRRAHSTDGSVSATFVGDFAPPQARQLCAPL